MTSAWIVDPISYSGLAYYDLGLADGLARAGVPVTLVGSDRWLVRRELPGVTYRLKDARLVIAGRIAMRIETDGYDEDPGAMASLEDHE